MRIAENSTAQQEQISKIVKSPGKDEWCVKSEKNPDWSGGCYPSKEKARSRLNQVEMFKHMGMILASTFDYMKSFLNVQQQSVPMDRENLDLIWNTITATNDLIDELDIPEEGKQQIEDWGKTPPPVPGNPPAWVANESIWDKAKAQVKKNWNSYDEPWAIVADVYEKMGGKKK